MVKVGTYNGCPTLSLPLSGKYTFTFGLKKAQAIAQYYDQILEFISSQTLDPTPVEVPFVIPAEYVPKKRSLAQWIVHNGGVKENSLPGEMRDLITGEQGKRAKGIPPGFLNNERGRGLDEIVDEANSDDWQIRDESHLLEMLEAEQRAAYNL